MIAKINYPKRNTTGNLNILIWNCYRILLLNRWMYFAMLYNNIISGEKFAEVLTTKNPQKSGRKEDISPDQDLIRGIFCTEYIYIYIYI